MLFTALHSTSMLAMATKPTKVAIIPETIRLSVTGDSCNLFIPRVQSPKSHDAPSRRVCDSHARFRFQAEPRSGVAYEKVRKRADLEIAAIFSTFPDVTDSNTILAMAAWFYLLYTVDDLVEEMHNTTMAVESLKASSTIFSSRIGDRRQSFVPDYLNVSKGPLPDRNDPDYQLILPLAVAYACRAFRNHVRQLVSEDTYQRLVIAIADVWAGMESEIAFRRQRRSSVAPYMAIRQRTIGLTPFFVLLRRNGDRYDPWFNPNKCEHTVNLEAAVKTAVGIQNDLVGLTKDLREGEHMNAALLGLAKMDLSSQSESGSESGQSTDTESLDVVNDIIRAGAARAVALHNQEVERAYSYLEKMEDKDYGLMLVGFIERHLRWAQMTARYKMAAGITPSH